MAAALGGCGLSRKAVVVGNGPSLNAHLEAGDFDLLVGVDTLAVNRIDLLYGRTAWRPMWWVWTEQLGPDFPGTGMVAHALDAHILPGIEWCIVERRWQKPLMEELNRRQLPGSVVEGVRYVWRGACPHYGQVGGQGVIPAAWHLPEVCAFGGAISAALQLAYMLGYDDVGLIGCDLSIGWEPDHFDPSYHSYTDGVLYLQDDTLRAAHRLARRGFEGRRLVNVGIGGALEVHPRMDLRRWLDA